MPICAVDVETTGASENDRVWEIGAVRYDHTGREASYFQGMIDPGIPISEEIQKLCNVTQEEVTVNGRPAAEVLRQFALFSDGAVLVAYNAPFDVRFLEMERHRLG